MTRWQLAAVHLFVSTFFFLALSFVSLFYWIHTDTRRQETHREDLRSHPGPVGGDCQKKCRS